MSQPSFESAEASVEAPTVLTKKSPWNAYNVLLLIGLCALVLGCVMLTLELVRYGFQFKGPAF
jgi:hypothetical protein